MGPSQGEPVRWGFLGAGNIVTKALAPAIHTSPGNVLHAVGARDPERSRGVGPVRAYDSYQAVIDDPDVEAVYIALTNDVHVQWSIAALEAGKHVLCEKPLAMNAAEVAELMAAADRTGRLAVEASWNRWHPRTRRLQEIVHSGALGALRHISAAFTYDSRDPGNYRMQPGLGGGSLYDLGPYSVAAAVWLTGFAEVEVEAVDIDQAASGVDLTTRARLICGGVPALCLTSMDIPESQWLIVTGEDATALLPGGDAFTSWQAPSRLEVFGTAGARVEEFAAVDPYRLMLEAVGGRVRGGDDWVMPLTESLAFARLFDRLRAPRDRDRTTPEPRR